MQRARTTRWRSRKVMAPRRAPATKPRRAEAMDHGQDAQATRLDGVYFAAVAAFAVEHLAAFFGTHAGAEADFSDAFGVGDFVGVMHFERLLSFASDQALRFHARLSTSDQ